MILALGEYLPDLPAVGNPGLVTAKNAIPYATSYRSFPSPVVYSGALSNRCQGAVWSKDKDGNVYGYAGDTSALYRLADTTWTRATRASGGDYQLDTDDFWEFAHWGEQVIATDYYDAIQVITFGQSNFAALSGMGSLKARHVAVVKDFVVFGNCTDYSSGTAVSNRIHWTGYQDITTAAPSASTQADYQDLQGEGGEVQRIVGGEYGIILQQHSIWRMTYVGSPLVFQFDEIEPGNGTPSPMSVVNKGAAIFYLGQDDFYMFNGSASIPIGKDKVYQTFIDDLDANYKHRVSAAIDPIRPIVLWAYPASGNTGGNPNKILVYNWAINKWAGPVETNVELLTPSMALGYTLDGLDSVNSSIDALAFSLDSRIWAGGTLNLSCFDADHKMCNFTGSALAAEFETGDRQLFKKNRAFVSNIIPVVEGGTVTMRIGTRNLLTESASFGSSISVNSDGECPAEAEGRYHRFRMTVSGTFSHAQGLEIEATAAGRY